MYISHFQKIDTYDWFGGPGSHIIVELSYDAIYTWTAWRKNKRKEKIN